MKSSLSQSALNRVVTIESFIVEQERRHGHTFRKDGPTYARLERFARTQRRLPVLDNDPDDLGGCSCTD